MSDLTLSPQEIRINENKGKIVVINDWRSQNG